MNEQLLDLLKTAKKEDVRLFCDEQNNSYVLINNKPKIKGVGFSTINLHDAKANKIGELQYCFMRSSNKYVYLRYIVLTDEKSYGKGLGTYLIKFLEEITAKNKVKRIEGKFFPESEKTKDRVEKFYVRNGYGFEKNEQELTVYKIVKQNEIDALKENSEYNKKGYKVYHSLKQISTSNQEIGF